MPETTRFRVAGVSYENRQEVVMRCVPGQVLTLVREPTNPHDPNAIQIVAGDEQVGFVPAWLAKRMAPALDQEREAVCIVVKHNVPPADAPDGNVGLTVAVSWLDELTAVPDDSGDDGLYPDLFAEEDGGGLNW